MSWALFDQEDSLSLNIRIKSLFQQVFAQFLLFLSSKKIDYSVVFTQIDLIGSIISRHTFSRLLSINLPIRATLMKVLCKIQMRLEIATQKLAFSIVYQIQKLGGKPIVELGGRTKIGLMASVEQINRYLRSNKSCLTLCFSQFDSIAMVAKISIAASNKAKNIKQQISSILLNAFNEFIKYFGELDCIQFFSGQVKPFKYKNLYDLLCKICVSKSRLFLSNNNKNKKTINNCLSFLVKTSRSLEGAFKVLQNQNSFIGRYIRLYDVDDDVDGEKIADAIKILNIEQANFYNSYKFKQNLNINGAISIKQSMNIKKVSFERKKSFSILRQNRSNQIIFHLPERFQDQNINQQHLILKRCIIHNQMKTSDSLIDDSDNKSKMQSGHQNEHNFILLNGNRKCPYIGKYYLDIKQGNIMNISNRKIMSRFQNGDLFTQVVYKQFYHLKQYNLLEYLTIFEQLCLAASFMNHNKIVHRDIKPTNILFKYLDRNRFICKLIDFGSCYVRSKEGSRLFNSKLYTTQKFNLTYKKIEILTKNSFSSEMDRDTFQRHELFDIYSIAETILYLIDHSSLKSYKNECLNLIFQICKQYNPNNRLTPQQLIIIIRHLKLIIYEQNNMVIKLRDIPKIFEKFNYFRY